MIFYVLDNIVCSCNLSFLFYLSFLLVPKVSFFHLCNSGGIFILCQFCFCFCSSFCLLNEFNNVHYIIYIILYIIYKRPSPSARRAGAGSRGGAPGKFVCFHPPTSKSRVFLGAFLSAESIPRSLVETQVGASTSAVAGLSGPRRSLCLSPTC